MCCQCDDVHIAQKSKAQIHYNTKLFCYDPQSKDDDDDDDDDEEGEENETC